MASSNAGSPPSLAWVTPWQREWLAASMGCTIADTAFNPLEVLKVRRQTAMAASSGSGASAGPASTLALARAAAAEKGILRGLWLPGLEATCYRAFSYTGFRIGLYPSVRDAIVGSGAVGGPDSVPARVAAGAATGAVGSALFNPIDVVRIRMQGPAPYPTTLGAFAAIARDEGVVAGLWRGTSACVGRAMMLSGSQLATYDTAKRALKSRGAMEEGPALHFTASFASGVVAQTVTQPMDTLKTLVMAKSGARGARRRRRRRCGERRAPRAFTAGSGQPRRDKDRSWWYRCPSSSSFDTRWGSSTSDERRDERRDDSEERGYYTGEGAYE